jgi:hypothetical protein
MTPAPSQQTALQKQIDDLGVRMDRGFEELKGLMIGYEGRLRGIETREAGCQPIINSRMDAAWKAIDVHSADIKAHTEDIQSMKQTIVELKRTNALLSWIGGLSGSAIIVWLIGQLLGLIA